MLAFFLEDSTHFVAQYIPHIVFPFRRFYVTKFLVTTGFRSVARIFQRVRVGWGGVGWGGVGVGSDRVTPRTYLTVMSTFTLSFNESEFCRMTT